MWKIYKGERPVKRETYKQKFQREHNLSYEAFRTWLKTHHNTNFREIRELDQFDYYLNEYKNSKLNSNFEKRNGFTHRSFATYVWNRHGYGLKDLPESIYGELLAEYKDYRMKKDFSKCELYDLLGRYVVAFESGDPVEADDREIELINHLLNR